MKIKNYHDYSGNDSQWHVEYAYETLIGSGFEEPYGELAFQRQSSAPLKGEFRYQFSSMSGTQQLDFQTVQNNGVENNVLRVHVNPTHNGYLVNGLSAKVTVHYEGKKDTILLKKKQ